MNWATRGGRLGRAVTSAVAAVVTLTVVAGPGGPVLAGVVEYGAVRPVVQSSLSVDVQPMQGDPGPKPVGGDSGGSGGEAVAPKPPGQDDSSSGGKEASAPEPKKSDNAPGVSGGGPDPEPRAAAPEASGGGSAGGAEPAPEARASGGGPASGSPGESPVPQVSGGPPPAGESQPGPDGAAQAAASSPTPGPAPAEGADATAVAGAPPAGGPSPADAAVSGVPGGRPDTPLAVAGSKPMGMDPGAESALREYRAGLAAEQGPLDFGTTAVGPDQWNSLVAQEGGNVETFNEAVQDVGGPNPTVTQSPILLRDDQGRFGTSTLFRVTGADGKPQLVDSKGARYTDTDDYLESNRLPDDWTMIRPAGLGTPDGAGDGLISGPAHNTTTWQKLGKVGDQIAQPVAAAGGALVTGAAVAEAASVGTATPVAGPAAAVGGIMLAAGGGWMAARSGEDLIDRYQHGRSLSPADPEARSDYLALATAGAGGARGLARGLGRAGAASAADATAFGTAGVATADQGRQLAQDWSGLTPEQRTERTTQLADSAGMLGLPMASRRIPEGSLRSANPPRTESTNRQSGSVQPNKDSPGGVAFAGEGPPAAPEPVVRPDGGLTRQDRDFQGMYNPKGDVKSHLDDSGNMFPANPNGKTSVVDHIVGGRAKSDSPYTSWSGPGSSPKDFGGTSKISLDRQRLERDIASGRVTGVEVIPPERVQSLIQNDANRIANREVNINTPPDLSPPQLRKEAQRIASSIDGLNEAQAQAVIDADLDAAISLKMEIDHGAVQPLEVLFGSIAAKPVIPIFVNSVAPPFASMRRVRQLGTAVGNYLKTLDKKVLLIGSGGLSHDPPVPQIATATPEQKAMLLNGRHPTAAARNARQQRVIDTAAAFAKGEASIMDLNPEWDREFLSIISSGELEKLDTWTAAEMAAAAGNSAHEVRNWVAAYNALRAAGEYTVTSEYYRPIPEFIAGFGVTTAVVK